MQAEPRKTKAEGLVNRAGALASSIFPLGITARLTITFLAVAVLAAAANLITQESVSVILWNTPPTAPPQPAVTIYVPDRHGNGLMSAVEKFDRSIQLRTESNSTKNDADYAAAIDLLSRTARDYPDGAPAKGPLAQRITEYLDAGQQLVRIADERRRVRDDHARLIQAIGDRMQATLDSVWKILDKLIVPQSLMLLRAKLDAVREHSAKVVAGESLDENDRAALLDSENAYLKTIASDGKKLTKSVGADWVRRTRTDFDELVALRTTLSTLNDQYNDAVRRISENRVSLDAAINAAESAAARAKRAASAPPPAPQASWTAQPAPSAEVLSESAIRHLDRHSSNVMATVTAVVLLLVTAISILTVRSIVRPVRRILEGSSALAAGNARVQVARGGIRELDTLADAFNDMASKLAAAQEASRSQQENLEETVRERTHMLQTIAQQDPLTSLPNRRHLSALLNKAIERASLEKRYVGVYFLDIDNFKNFNDSLGHVFGDRVLMSVANRLREIADGIGFVARLGGDEFTFVFETCDSEQAIHDMGLHLVRSFQQLLAVDDREFSVSVSVGASIFPDHERNADGLLRAADSALFRAKELGRNRLAVFTPELTESAAARFTIEQGLRRALEHGEFELVYQPEVDLATLEVGLVEALLRWRMPDGRVARPEEFLAVAEQSGVISDISQWVLRTAVEAASHWHHGGWSGARVAINISPRQLLDQRFAHSLLGLLHEFRLPPAAIELELTETVVQTGLTTIAALRVLQSHGFGIALDDFGTGYSSLTSLEKLPLSRIKLDRSLIASIDSSARSRAIARAIIGLCSGLDLQVTAEGVERPTQLAWLLGNRSMFLQGYLISDAVSASEVLSCRSAMLPKMHKLLLSMPDAAEPRTRKVKSL
jgi:diguanylate cyclase (GGDEF)-like protein